MVPNQPLHPTLRATALSAGSAPALGRMQTSRHIALATAAGALGPALLEASPLGPARNLATAARLFFLTYPAAVVLIIVYVGPGFFIARRLRLNVWWVVPSIAVLLRLLVTAAAHWPPSRWWPTVETGAGSPKPSRYVLSFGIEAWHGYLYSLWPATFVALVAAMSFLVALQLTRPNNALEQTREV